MDFWKSVLQCRVILGISFQFQRKRMPDGHNKIYGAQVIYSNVTRKHSGTYVCEGSNGSGFIAKDTIKIDVIRKYFNLFRWQQEKCNEMHLYHQIILSTLFKKSIFCTKNHFWCIWKSKSGFWTPKSRIRVTYFFTRFCGPL